MDEKLFIQIKNRISEITQVSQSLSDFCTKHQLPKKTMNDLDLALDEILNNIINYGYDDQSEHEISIQLYLAEEYILLTVIDDGRKFNPMDVPSADTESSLQERPIGGLGIHLLRNVMDEVDYKYEKNKNCLTMKKNIRGI
jgi:anti-sigma regulatory factor (Ser/Thr protein kinase)